MPPEWECLPSFVSKRLDYILSPLSLCLRIGSLMQFPSTSDFINLAFACRGGFASLAAIFALSVDDDYTAPKQDSRAAADSRSRGKSYSRTIGSERSNAATQALQSASAAVLQVTSQQWETPFFWTGDARFLSRERKWGSHPCSAYGAASPRHKVPLHNSSL